jgi:hypothetical protein
MYVLRTIAGESDAQSKEIIPLNNRKRNNGNGICGGVGKVYTLTHTPFPY